MKKNTMGRVAAFMVSVCMMTGMMSQETLRAVAATGAGEAYTVNLNRNGVIYGIDAPGKDASGEWAGSRIYYGTYSGKPLLWRVLDQDYSDGSSNMMLLQTEHLIGKEAFSKATPVSSLWENSSIRTWLNGKGTGQFLAGFGPEAEQIRQVDKNQGAVTDGYTNPARKNDKVFLLSAEEAVLNEYGMDSAKARQKGVSSGNSSSWWLRSAASGVDTTGAVIGADGKLTAQELLGRDGAAIEAGVAPALYLDTSRIWFTTPADGKKDQFTQVNKVTGATDWKLTLLKDGNLGASLGSEGSAFRPGDMITVNHNAAVSVLEKATQVSAMLMDESGQLLYYGKINGSSAVSSRITVPQTLKPGKYQLTVFAEQVNGPKKTDYACNPGSPITLEVKITPQIVTLPGAAPITYGQSLADSIISGGSVKALGNAIPGTFTWKTPETKPGVSDSRSTEYDILFTPQDTVSYTTVEGKITLPVEKAANTPNTPAASVSVEFGTAKVKQVPLPEGWSWRPEDVEKDLTAGGSTQAIARYADSVNYQNVEVTVTISRKACAHAGGAATCTRQAICTVCGQPYGSVDLTKHGATTVKNTKNANCTEKGYTGDTYCNDCGQIIARGQETAVLGHDYTSKVTKEPTVYEQGSKLFTCTRCGNQYTEAIPVHSHYYHNVKTIHWVGCVQQGEIEYSCDCGDSYVEVTPALGHDFKVEVTTKATAQKAGVKTYTCKRCGYVYTEAIPKLSGGSSGSGSGGGSGSSGGSGNGSVDNRKPFVKGNSSISGWTGIDKEIGKAAEGDTINISMNDSLILPAKTLKTLKGKDVTLVLDIGNDIKWSVNGKDITSDSLKDFNLKVTKNSNSIPAELVKGVAGELGSMQLSLAHEGDFGCTATLQVLLDSTKAGYYANLFYYDKESGALDYMSSVQMDGKGIAGLPLTHASDYLVVLDTAVMDGTKPTEPEPEETPQPSEPEETVPVDNPEPAEKDDAGGISATLIIVIGLIVLGLGLLLIVVLRARSKKEDVFDEQ